MSDFLFKKETKEIKIEGVKKPSFWSKEEDKILMDKAKEYHFKNWNSVAKFIPGKSSIQCSARYRRIRPGLIKGVWDKDEDLKLLALYKKYGKNWATISKEMPQRTGKQIRDRFLNCLDSKYDRGKFTEKEDRLILKYHKIYGNSWAKIAKKLKTRTGDMVKNRFHSSLKKYVSNNKNFLRKKRLNPPAKDKNKISEDRIIESQNDKYPSDDQKDSKSEENAFNEKKEEKIISNIIDNFNIIKNENEIKDQEKNELNSVDNNSNNYLKNYIGRDNSNHIKINKDLIKEPLDYSKNINKIGDDDYENGQKFKGNIFNTEENNKKIIEPEFNGKCNYKYNPDDFRVFINNIRHNSFYSLNKEEKIDERLVEHKKCPYLEMDYNQNLREQLDIISNLENIIKQKLLSIQKQIENN